jgi:hypothetical protein
MVCNALMLVGGKNYDEDNDNNNYTVINILNI